MPLQSPRITSSRQGIAIRATLLIALAASAIAAPFFVYPLFLMKILCFALFASALNLALGYAGLLSL